MEQIFCHHHQHEGGCCSHELRHASHRAFKAEVYSHASSLVLQLSCRATASLAHHSCWFWRIYISNSFGLLHALMRVLPWLGLCRSSLLHQCSCEFFPLQFYMDSTMICFPVRSKF